MLRIRRIFDLINKSLDSPRNFSVNSRFCGSHQMPDRLAKIAEAEDPNFFEMVEYHYHRAVIVLEDAFVQQMQKYQDMTEEARIQRVKGIIAVMSICQNTIELSFPIRRDCGDYEIINGYLAHHNTHRYQSRI